jgi:hypothetical protein
LDIWIIERFYALKGEASFKGRFGSLYICSRPLCKKNWISLQDFRKPDWKKWLEFTAEEFDDYAERNTGKISIP